MRFSTVAAVLLAVVMVAFPVSARDKQYSAKQIDLTIDGVLNEWGDSDVIVFDQLKDAGAALPDPADFSGEAMVGWNSSDPNRVYFAVTIMDSELQDIHPADDRFWEDDSMEFMFDFDNGMVRETLVQWNVAADGEEISAAATAENTEWIVVNDGDQYIFEVAIDPTKDNPATPGLGVNFKAEAGVTIGLSIHYNDCENGVREHQTGWIAGQAWGAENFGDLIFDAASVVASAVEFPGKLTTTWGGLKSR